MNIQKGFAFIFYGLLFALLNFEINHVSILPSFIGFIIVLQGLRLLEKQDDRLRPIFLWMYGLIFIALINWITSFTRGDQAESMSYSQGSFFIDLPTINLYFISSWLEKFVMLAFVMLIMNYFIILIKENRLEKWEDVFSKQRVFYVVVNVFLLIIIPIVLIFPAVLSLIFALLLFLNFIAIIRIVIAAYRMKRLTVEGEIALVEDKVSNRLELSRKKGVVTSVTVFIILCWGVGLTYASQLHVNMPLLLPAFVATTENNEEDILLYYLYSSDRDKEIAMINNFPALNQYTAYRDGFHMIKEIRIEPFGETIIHQQEGVLVRLRDESTIDNVEPFSIFKLDEAKTDSSEYLEFQGSRWGVEGVEVTFKVLESFKMTEGLSLPFKEELHDYFLFGWRVDQSHYHASRESGEYYEGDIITFFLRPKERQAGLATLQAPLRVEIEDVIYDLTWISQQPSFSSDWVKEFVRENK